MKRPLEVLDRIADKVLSHRAAARTKKAKKRQRARRSRLRSSRPAQAASHGQHGTRCANRPHNNDISRNNLPSANSQSKAKARCP